MATAKKAGCIIALVPRVGDFVATGDPLIHLHGAGAAQVNQRSLRSNIAFGPERTIEQDSTFAFRVVVDIALKALSKAINDPTTAVLAVDQLQRLLRTVGQRILHDARVFDEEGQLRLILPTPNWLDFVKLTCTEIRSYGAENIQVARRLRAMLEALLGSLSELRRTELLEELNLLDRQVERSYVFPEDKALARVPDTQGLGGSSSPPS